MGRRHRGPGARCDPDRHHWKRCQGPTRAGSVPLLRRRARGGAEVDVQSGSQSGPAHPSVDTSSVQLPAGRAPAAGGLVGRVARGPRTDSSDSLRLPPRGDDLGSPPPRRCTGPGRCPGTSSQRSLRAPCPGRLHGRASIHPGVDLSADSCRDDECGRPDSGLVGPHSHRPELPAAARAHGALTQTARPPLPGTAPSSAQDLAPGGADAATSSAACT